MFPMQALEARLCRLSTHFAKRLKHAYQLLVVENHEMAKNLEFGGNWTLEKLNILRAYLNDYTTALKNQHFELIYIDAFAGSGSYSSTDYRGFQEFHKGSVQIALEVKDKEFDKLVFVEKNRNSYRALEDIRSRHSKRSIELVNKDANIFLNNLRQDWVHKRGVLFLDPFGTQVAWQTIEYIASLNALDLWILFPASAVARLLPLKQEPDKISEQWAKRLTEFYGNENWRTLYKPQYHKDLFDGEVLVRQSGTKELVGLYKQQLKKCFGQRFLRESRSLKNSKDAPLFEFMFCAGHPSGTSIAKRIAKHLVEQL